MIQVGINGYGTIGKRVADAIVEQPDMTVLGVAKTRPNYEATAARQRGFALYSAVPERANQFAKAGLETAGDVDALVAESDIVVDATPSGIGAENKSLYETHDTPAIFQGGESHDLVDASFNARSNFEQGRGSEYVRVVSCNTTGLARLLAPLRESLGVEKVRATLVRRGGDPPQSGRGPINDILPNPVTLPSHHGPDVNTIFPDLDIDTLGLKVPATLMHMHSINVTMESASDASEIRQLLDGESRLFLIDDTVDIEGTGALKDYALDMGRPRGDLWENGIWAESLTVEGSDLYLFQAIHQESDVVPENVDAIRAMLETENAQTSRERTNRALGIA